MNHGVQDYPAGRYLIEGNYFEGQTTNKCISIDGFYDNIEIKNNQFINAYAIGISVGSSATPIINKLDIVGNTFKGLTKTTISVIQQVSLLRMIDNYAEEGGNAKLIQFGDGTNNGTIDHFELRGNYLVNKQSNCIFYSQGSVVNTFVVKDNTMLGTGCGIDNANTPRMILTGNYINVSNATVRFVDTSTGNVYTNANVLSKAITLNNMTEQVL